MMFEEIPLKLRKVSAVLPVTGQMAASMHLSVASNLESFVRNELLYRLQAQVWTHNLPPEHFETERTFTIEAPVSWWQHFKEQYAGTWWCGWLARRRPPVMGTARRTVVTLSVDLSRFRVYPDAPAMPAQYGRAVAHHEISERVTWRDR